MTLPAPTYDLVLLLDPQAEEQARTRILEDTRAAIATAGEVVREDDWGDRSLAYPIARKRDAEYHLLQFHAGAPGLLHELDRTLRITDGVLRFRIVKLKPGTPAAPDMRSGAGAAPARHGEPQAPTPAAPAQASSSSSSSAPPPQAASEAPAQAPTAAPAASTGEASTQATVGEPA